MSKRPHRRGNARAARMAKRLDASSKTSPIRAGLSGGAYKPLSLDEVNRVHDTACDVLERIGVGTPIPLLVELATARGAWLNDKGRLCFPRKLIDEIIEGAAKELTLFARDPKYDLKISDRLLVCS